MAHPVDHAVARASLLRDGFALVENAFPAEAVSHVAAICRQLVQAMATERKQAHRFMADMSPSGEAEAGVRAGQIEIRYPAALAPPLLDSALFKSCAHLANAIGGPLHRSFDHLIVKQEGSFTTTPWHQDVAFRRFGPKQAEGRLSRLHFWIPLQDTGETQGCMEFIAGSHRNRYRHRPFARRSGGTGYEAVMDGEGHRVICPVPVGGLTIHTATTLHHTGANMSPAPRGAWIIQFSRLGHVEIGLKHRMGLMPRPVIPA